jgi:hypothetical protein
VLCYNVRVDLIRCVVSLIKTQKRGLRLPKFRYFVLIAGALSACAVILGWAAGPSGLHAAAVTHVASPPMPAENRPAPDFALTDSNGHRLKLSDYRGHPVALHFFCGCHWCKTYARLWGQLQRGGALPQTADGKIPVTMIVFQGDPQQCKDFENETGLDPAHTVICPDAEDLHVTLSVYNAEPCPKAFIVNATGEIVYANVHNDDQSRVAPEMKIVSRAIDALRKACTAEMKPAADAPPAR